MWFYDLLPPVLLEQGLTCIPSGSHPNPVLNVSSMPRMDFTLLNAEEVSEEYYLKHD